MKNIRGEIVDYLFIKKNIKIMTKDRLIFIIPVKEKALSPIMASIA